ncbi:phosphopantetheine-binding protein [Streptantibioticus parmotrematis]|uniref:phosphopantetheine-binding protein n=1 Tax=Streptantibioticus parmotrematis TaxID=2873249 RepID=UPI0027DF96C3|nr:phosphopantetheine-binding protein [Streptantibioticus parmotrematis]
MLDALGDDPAPGAAGNTSAWTAERVRADVAAVLGDPPEDVPLDESLIDYGLDSIRLMTLVERWREEGAVVSITDFADRVTVRAWADVLAGARR